MPVYLVQLPEGGDFQLINGKNAAVVVAEDTDDAKAIAKSALGVDADAPWANATVTECAAEEDMEGYQAQVIVYNASGVEVTNVTVTAVDTDDIDDIGGDLATALNAAGPMANASYNSTTNTLTIATGSGGDDLGDYQVFVNFFMPAAQAGGAVSIPGFVGTITDQGAATDALSVVLGADDDVIPTLIALVAV